MIEDLERVARSAIGDMTVMRVRAGIPSDEIEVDALFDDLATVMTTCGLEGIFGGIHGMMSGVAWIDGANATEDVRVMLTGALGAIPGVRDVDVTLTSMNAALSEYADEIVLSVAACGAAN